MDEAILEILQALREGELSSADVDRILRAHSKDSVDGKRLAKKDVLPRYFEMRDTNDTNLASLEIDDNLEKRFISCVQMKPRRTASGVATITVITKPWPCRGTCIFCPNDIRMPKSYLHKEPACQRAERCYFDPYLQVASRLKALTAMGHPTDKVELIVLGGTWNDYPEDYRIWFIEQLFSCLNESDSAREANVIQRKELYIQWGVSNDSNALALETESLQQAIDQTELTFNDAHGKLYGQSKAWQIASEFQISTWKSLRTQQQINETGGHRVVGLVIETRPEAISVESLIDLRKLGCTKIQIGVQSLTPYILEANQRGGSPEDIAHALSLCRLFGFKTHVHFMTNLLCATPESDLEDYRKLVSDKRYIPDEIKLYPCALVEGTPLMDAYDSGAWNPYSERELIELLADAMEATPEHMRISRMIRDISAEDIVVGNKKGNLRQLVDEELKQRGSIVEEIRSREIATNNIDLDSLKLKDTIFETSDTHEHFLQWVTPENRIAGFLRLSLPSARAIHELSDSFPIHDDEAMIREAHIYGFAARIDGETTSTQHRGLGSRLIEEAEEIARKAGYKKLNVISSVGTREYYRNLGFADNELYQQKDLL